MADPALPDTTPQPPADFVGPVSTANVNGVTIGYRRFGSGRPLLVLTGFGATMQFWQHELMSGLAGHGFEVAMMDHRGVGYSTDDPGAAMTHHLMARDALALIDHLGWQRPTIVGWSMGGEVALTMATIDGDRVGSIISSGGDAGSSHYADTTPEINDLLYSPGADPAALLPLLFPDGSPGSEQAVAAFIESLLLFPNEELSEETFRRQAEAEHGFLRDETVWDALASITTRVVMQAGSVDAVVPPINAELVAAQLPDGVVEVFEGLGHGSLLHDHRRFANLVAEHA